MAAAHLVTLAAGVGCRRRLMKLGISTESGTYRCRRPKPGSKISGAAVAYGTVDTAGPARCHKVHRLRAQSDFIPLG